ncbi:MarR family transcriptional regulator [Glaciihabitans sp. UYNi722]|uniref:MarR family winged helix-turn-helix transcriptional regulator n=1 Tax=Glaciihabitans sp. UYNi722 TaxID=3156344 RepID=UPI003396E601
MPNNNDETNLEAAGSWAKKYFLASRALMEAVLRPYDLGNTQWYVLYLLANRGPMNQRDLTRQLEVERATLSAVLSALVRKGLIEQTPDTDDQRQKVLHMTTAGMDLWSSVPDPIALITGVAFEGVDRTEIETTKHVLEAATQRLVDYKKGATTS